MKKMKIFAILSLIVSSITYSNNIQLDSSKLQNTTIQQGKKGNTIININTPNEKGISVNDFENFQTKNGVVFNNSNARYNMSQLEGMIAGNPNISGEQAKLILNRVGGLNRTEIEGTLEAVGKEKVNMIFTSPNGIYLNGAKFIGFKDVTFTTGSITPYDDAYNPGRIQVRNGEISIGEKGVDASKIETLALFSKYMSLNGSITGKGITIVLGDSNISYGGIFAGMYESVVANDNKELMISASEFGSIYGDQIMLMAAGGNIAVKGDIITDEIMIWSEGDIKVNNLSYNNWLHAYESKRFIVNGNIHGGEDSKISMKGEFHLNGENAYMPNLNFYGSLINNSNAIIENLNGNGPILNNGVLYVSEKLKNEGMLKNNGIIYSDKDMYSSVIENTVGGIILGEGNIKSGRINNNGIIISEGELSIDSELIDNLGTILGNDLQINAEKLNNGGVINAQNIEINTQDFNNSGGTYSSTNLFIKSKKLANSGSLESKKLKLTFKDFSFQGGTITAENISFDFYTE